MRFPDQAPPLARSGRGRLVRRFRDADGLRLSQYDGEEEGTEEDENGESGEMEGGDEGGEAAVESD